MTALARQHGLLVTARNATLLDQIVLVAPAGRGVRVWPQVGLDVNGRKLRWARL